MFLQPESQLFPEQASSVSGGVDALFFFLVGLTIFFGVLISGTIFVFAVRYRRRSEDEMPERIEGSIKLEIIWSVIPLIIAMCVFAWGASLYFKMYRVPSEAIEISTVAKQWMWKFQHADGRQEINELHVPLGSRVKLTMTTEDVIHSFFVPAFRIKMDVVPGRYTTAWFEATKPGRYHLFCAEYCGTSHSGMIGWVEVMEPQAFQAWLAGGAPATSLAAAGQKLFQDLACNQCHRADAQGRGPALEGLFGSRVELDNGRTVVADESYLRESIFNSQAKVVVGFPRPSIMPVFQGVVSEEQVLQLVAYIKSIGPQQKSTGSTPGASSTAPQQPGGNLAKPQQ
ncbi:MAG TPA: cytochrome c oxidase subunit II [Blastocatellia bacterium]|nr:cytochrome c oxidase subunit II [Blastocatellia bacterium]